MENKQQIIQIKDFKEVSQYLTRDTQLFIDIDDTVINSRVKDLYDPNEVFKYYLKKGKFNYYKKYHFMSYCSSSYLDLVKYFNEEIQRADTKLTDRKLPLYLKKWDKKTDYYIYYLTARGAEISKYTHKVLKHHKINLSDLRKTESIFLKSMYPINNITGRSGWSSQRVVYCGGYHKGEIVKSLIKQARSTLAVRIVLIDDSLYALEQLNNTMKELNIEFVGIHYAKQYR